MNRKQRRALGIKTRMPTISVSRDQYDADIQRAKDEATELSLTIMLCIPAMILNRDYPKLMKKFENGKSRGERFIDLFLEQYRSLRDGKESFKALIETVEKETGYRIVDSKIVEKIKKGEKPW